MIRTLSTLLILFVFSAISMAQNDTIVSRNGDMLIGEIKSLEKGVLILKTDYSDKDFNIEWEKIDLVFAHSTFLIALSDGRRLNGSIVSHPGTPSLILISGITGHILINDLLEIVYINPIKGDFFGRLKAEIGVGYSFTKAKNHHQFNVRSNLGYLADTWGSDASLDIIRSVQDSVAPTRRTDGTIGFRKLFKRSWFLSLSNNFLQNDEQKLKLRSTTNLSAGHMLMNSYKTYWSVGAGFAYNSEEFTSDQPNEKSLEGLINTELNLFAHEDISLLTSLKVYPSITVKGRIRSDFKFDFKYDLPLDFYIKLGFTNNYDNKPIAGASKNDYVIQTTFGWEL